MLCLVKYVHSVPRRHCTNDESLSLQHVSSERDRLKAALQAAHVETAQREEGEPPFSKVMWLTIDSIFDCNNNNYVENIAFAILHNDMLVTYSPFVYSINAS